MKADELKNELFKKVQDYLKPVPAIIWGSGATIPFGMPSMDCLKNELGISDEGNLEDILSNKDDKSKKQYESKIFNIINQRDKTFRESLSDDSLEANNLKQLINYFYKAHPQLINIITTNYDCVLEYVLAYHSYPFADGFTGREFSQFDKSIFKTKEHINLYKVHGSLRWSNQKYSHCNEMMDAIFPNKDKSLKAHQEPFRTLIQKSDEVIENAKCFLVIGFGFNDEHLTPKIETAIKKGKSIVIVTKKVTHSCRNKLNMASKCVLIEEVDDVTTRFIFIEKDKQITNTLPGKYWQIGQFIKILGI